jgi:hypothetical protein
MSIQTRLVLVLPYTVKRLSYWNLHNLHFVSVRCPALPTKRNCYCSAAFLAVTDGGGFSYLLIPYKKKRLRSATVAVLPLRGEAAVLVSCGRN